MTYSKDQLDDNSSTDNIKRKIGVANKKAIQNFFNKRQKTFTKSMKIIAKSIVQDPDVLINNKLNSFSKVLDFGETSIIRFCKRLGFKGFCEFRRYFIHEFYDLPTNYSNTNHFTSIQKTPIETLNVISNLISHVTDNTKRSLLESYDYLVTVVDKIYYAPRVFIYGSHASQAIIKELEIRFTSIGVTVISATELSDMINKSSLIQKCDVCFVICTSGYSTDLVNITSSLNKNDVYTVSITADLRSELAVHSNVAFSCFADNELTQESCYDSMYTHLSQMIIFEMILDMLTNRDICKSQEHHAKTHTILNKVLLARTNATITF